MKIKERALRRTLQILRPHTGGQRALAAAGGVALLFEVVFRVLEPWPVKFVVDAVTTSLGADLAVDAPRATVQFLVACGLATISIIGLRAVCNYLGTVALALVGSKVTTRLRQQVFEHVTELSMRYHSRSRRGDVVQRLVSDVGRLQEVLITAGMPMVVNVVTLLAMGGVMLWMDPLLTLAIVGASAAYLLLAWQMSPKITKAARKTRRSEGDLANIANETLGAMQTVQAYNLQHATADQFRGRNSKSLTDGVQARRLSASLERSTDVVVGVCVALVLVFGGYRVTQMQMTPGDLVLFLTYLKTSMKPLRDMAKYTGRIAKATASGERVADLLDERFDIVSPPNPVPVPADAGHIVLDSVTAAYDNQVPVLRELSLTIPREQQIALVGPSGSGKSTMASLLLRMIDPVQGAVSLDGHDLRELDLRQLRERIAFVPQEAVLFTGTIADNIRQGNPEASDAELRRAARAARVDEFVSRLPEGYETEIGERGGTLSGGQRQRIALARALLRDAPIVLLDEPTSGLDRENAAAVREAIGALSVGRTTIMITHDELMARSCDRVVWLSEGRVRWDGPAAAPWPAGLMAESADDVWDRSRSLQPAGGVQ
ncbi:ABC transporter ATP-binding protein [Naumannella halotolerans]|uniref:ATP-binding cassette subfamily B protein n=1 Tax=Naumannella halotolerans TaxID=993414 RepID=A0A4R7JCG3_9ACTN|nr:ABC transporter ATP-binding protein [Naumannella halotolerans]TDT34353.1 ATP-binding cassette subfamily B protein [Naumannella halotolerans]